MRLAFSDALLVTSSYDGEMSMLADRHYSRRKVGARQFLYSGRKLVIRNAEGTILFGWIWPQDELRLDDQTGYNCAIFRNESARRASDVIRECEAMALEKWGPNRMYTYVDGRQIRRTRQPGRCFLKAGWRYVRGADGKPRLSKYGLHLLEKDPREEVIA